jgi:hypothetical protein
MAQVMTKPMNIATRLECERRSPAGSAGGFRNELALF